MHDTTKMTRTIGFEALNISNYLDPTTLPEEVQKGLKARAYVHQANEIEITHLYKAISKPITQALLEKAVHLLKTDKHLLEETLEHTDFKILPCSQKCALKFLITNKTLHRAREWIKTATTWVTDDLFKQDILNIDVTDKKFALYYLACACNTMIELSSLPLIYKAYLPDAAPNRLNGLSFYSSTEKCACILNGGYILSASIQKSTFRPTDCAGFIQWIYGFSQHFTTKDYADFYEKNKHQPQATLGNKTLKILTSFKELQPGDLINWRFMLRGKKEDGHIIIFLCHINEKEYLGLECAYLPEKRLEGLGLRIFKTNRPLLSLGFFRVLK